MGERCSNCDYHFDTEDDCYIDEYGILRCSNCSAVYDPYETVSKPLQSSEKEPDAEGVR